VEDLERSRRRLLVRVVKDFVSLGDILKQAREMVVEFKRRKFTVDCDYPGDEGKKEDEVKKELSALLDVLFEHAGAIKGIVGEEIRLVGRAGENANSIIVLLEELKKNLKAKGLI